MTNARPGYWDVERCAWEGAEPTHVVPPAPAPDLPAGEAAVPTPRTGVESIPSMPSSSAIADSAGG